MANGLAGLAQRATQPRSPQIDFSAPPQPTLPANPANPRYSMLSRLASAANQAYAQPAWDKFTVFGDVARGKASMADPETQARVMGAATSMGGPAPEGALGVGMPLNFGEMNNEMLQAFHTSHNSKILSVINTIQMIENFGRGIAAEHPGWNEYLGKLARPDLMNLQGKYERMFDQLISRRDTARAELRRRGLWK